MLVSELLTDPALYLQVQMWADQDRPIRWVHTIEVPRPGRFLQGGEVVLTAGVWRNAGVTAEDFLSDLSDAGVAAVGFGIVPPETEVPHGFVAAARHVGITCFVVPAQVAFLQVVETFVNAKRVEWERPLRRHLDQHDAIVAALRGKRGISSVLGVLGRALNVPVAVRLAGEVVAGDPPEPAHSVTLVGEGLADAELLLTQPFDTLDVEQHGAVVQAMPFLALEIERDRAVRARDLQYAWELFEWVQRGGASTEAVHTRLHALGFPMSGDGVLAGIVVLTGYPDADARRLGEILGSDGIAVRRSDHVVALTRVHGDVSAAARTIHDSLVQRDDRVRQVGVGESATMDQLRMSLLQAGYAAEAVSRRNHSGWMTHEALNSPSLLLAVQQPEMLAATARSLLGPVLEYEERRGGDLVGSLAVFLDSGGSWQEAARRLHVHINTLRHRMSRIEELTGRSVADTGDRVDLYLATRALRHG